MATDGSFRDLAEGRFVGFDGNLKSTLAEARQLEREGWKQLMSSLAISRRAGLDLIEIEQYSTGRWGR